MSQRGSGYARKERDLYETPAWVTWALLPHIPERVRFIWEPACGSGKMVRALVKAGFSAYATDINPAPGIEPLDFLTANSRSYAVAGAIVTNPPYSIATLFISKALNLMHARGDGIVAMLLRADFDSARGRRDLFTLRPFAKKLILTQRIVWFEREDGKKAAPSENHAWFIWDWKHQGPATLAYGP